MIARLLISSDINKIKEEVFLALSKNFEIIHIKKGGHLNHPDILYFEQGNKIGISEAKKIKEHFFLKPFSSKGKGAVLEDASVMTVEAQNALLKTIEELPKSAVLILAASSEANILPTILSRCQVIRVQGVGYRSSTLRSETSSLRLEEVQQNKEDIEKLLTATTTERFEFIEKLKDKKGFLLLLASYYRNILYTPKRTHKIVKFLQEVLEAEKQVKQNVNARAILEYLMLVMP